MLSSDTHGVNVGIHQGSDSMKKIYFVLALFFMGFSSTSFSEQTTEKPGWFTHPTKKFSVKIPEGFKIKAEREVSLFLLSENPSQAGGSPYNSYLTISTNSKPWYIDKATLDDNQAPFSLKTITEYYKSHFGNAENYEILDSSLQTLDKGRPALLIYAQVKMGETPLYQAHLILADQKRSYLITYTDLAATFEQHFEQIYPVIAQIELLGPAPDRPMIMNQVMLYGIPLILFLLGYVIMAIRGSGSELSEEKENGFKKF